MEKINILENGLHDQTFEVSKDTHFFFGLDMRKMDSDVDITHKFKFMTKGIKVKIDYRYITESGFSCKNKVELTAIHGVKNVNAHLTMKSLILADNITTTLLPFLQIDERDVDVEHSVSMGSIDKEILFYLESRGLSKSTAKEIIAEEFVREI